MLVHIPPAATRARYTRAPAKPSNSSSAMAGVAIWAAFVAGALAVSRWTGQTTGWSI